MAGRIQGKVAVVTGGCSGIGLATVQRFVEEGAKVVIGDIAEQRGHELVGQLGGPDVATYVQVDVTDKEQVDALFKTAKDTYGSVDIAFNNAGISPPEDDSILDTDLEAWRRVQEVNLTSVFLCCKAALPYMLEQGRGSIINTASFVAVMGAATSQISYSASKGGVLSMSREACSSPGRECASTRCAPARSTRPCCRSCSPRTRSAPPGASCTSRSGGSRSRSRWPTPCCSWPPTSPASSPRTRSWWTGASPAPT
jgi:NAD(P)-dependent dehydrogenase (short-subunit alcohol dehydrogenase family)